MLSTELKRKTKKENKFDAPTPSVDADRRKLITHKWRTYADIKVYDVHCKVNLKQLQALLRLVDAVHGFEVLHFHLSMPMKKYCSKEMSANRFFHV
ncbi:hypothetical protein T09_4201 [Trichinella sp. T9]|nr:hypothetical protein T09_4201 [Trichinella sp. T9]